MATSIIVLFNLKAGVNPADYENWARTTDLPTVRKMSSVTDFEVLRASGLFGSDAKPPYQYIEVINIQNLEGFGSEASTPEMQAIASEFQQWADQPIFILADRI